MSTELFCSKCGRIYEYHRDAFNGPYCQCPRVYSTASDSTNAVPFETVKVETELSEFPKSENAPSAEALAAVHKLENLTRIWIQPDEEDLAARIIEAVYAPRLSLLENQLKKAKEQWRMSSVCRELTAKVAELEQDRDRLDWLETSGDAEHFAKVPNWFSLFEDVSSGRIASFRVAIDAARTAKDAG